MARKHALAWLATVPVALLLSGTSQAQFIDNTSDIPSGSPANNSSSENVDFADVDNDGDWDAVFADGGDGGNDQNRIWINQGGAQGGTVGVFVDRTAQQLPAISDTSRDVEFADIDNDGDVDLYVSNTSTANPQSNRWLINQGGLQGGQIGFFLEDPNRFVGVGGAGSSINPAFVLANGFVDWSCDCDFGDLDNDGDLDLLHTSYGGNFAGEIPTRIFLNDGAGFFSEFNPANHQVGASGTMNPGDPGIWCDGTYQVSTLNTNGTFCDIATTALDADLGDIDGDFDLDILHGDRNDAPRMFANRLEGSALAPAVGGGALGFRDVTHLSLPNGYSSGGGNYEQEMGDLDGDGDLDIYGLNWGGASFSLDDVTLRNTGDGTYDNVTILGNSGDDDNEGDFLDYDNDGDLDLLVADFSGRDRLYRNNNNGGSSFSLTDVTAANMPFVSAIALDADAADVDNDGDYDIFVANDIGTRNFYYENTNNIPDTTAPYIPHVEQAPHRAAGGSPTVIRAQVYDNAPYYITWYNPTWIEYTVNGGAPVQVPMRSSAGQIFRGEIPGNLVGAIRYEIFSEDQYGNQGQSEPRVYIADGSIGNRYCSPAVSNSTGFPGEMYVTGSDIVADDDLTLTALTLPTQSNIGYFLMGTGTNTFTPPGSSGPICVSPGLKRYLPPVNMTQEIASGGFMRTVGTMGPVSGAITPGSTWNFQAWHRDGMNPSNLTDAISVTFQ